MWAKLLVWAALAANALAVALNVGWLTSMMGRHAAGWALGGLFGLAATSVLLLSGPAATLLVLARHAPSSRR